MKHLSIVALAILGIAFAGCQPTKVSETRNIAYEHYCDSIWNANPDDYMDVLIETDEYQCYLEANGQWW